MAVTGIVTFANGDAMLAADQRTNIDAVVTWLNGGIVAADITALGLRTRNFRKMDHYGYEAGLQAGVQRSMGITGGYFAYSVGTAPQDRVFLTNDAQGQGIWTDVPTMCMNEYLPDAGFIEVEMEWWCWAPGSDRTDVTGGVEALAQCMFRIVIETTADAATERTLYDSAHDSDAVTQGGQFLYPARNFAVQTATSVSAGWTSIRLQVKFSVISLANKATMALVSVGARNMLVTYDVS